MKKILIVLGIVFITVFLFSFGEKDKKTDNCVATESYNDYVVYLDYVAQYFKTEKENGRHEFIYEGEFKAIWDKMGELYDIALKDSQKGPYLTPPPVFMTCWHCQCMHYGCSKSLGNECGYTIMCTTVCPHCGCECVQRWTNGDRCNQGAKCSVGPS